MEDKIRSFIALELSLEIRKLLKDLALKYQTTYPNGLRWVRSECIHMTIKFLGDATITQLEYVAQILERISQNTSPFRIEISGIGSFPSWTRPRTIWIGVKPVIELAALYLQVDEETVKIGFPSEGKRFSPHFTLCRVSNDADPLIISSFTNELQTIRSRLFGAMIIKRIVLLKSHLQRGGSVYTPISVYPFREQ
ncbi:MAG: RNA 2',3'-cyclic phosphodiesterase [Anaerolinea sp.]|nr:RNA 2',3'-cyclic phosphodiesterase [Anaerolinea sp.]